MVIDVAVAAGPTGTLTARSKTGKTTNKSKRFPVVLQEGRRCGQTWEGATGSALDRIAPVRQSHGRPGSVRRRAARRPQRSVGSKALEDHPRELMEPPGGMIGQSCVSPEAHESRGVARTGALCKVCNSDGVMFDVAAVGVVNSTRSVPKL